MDMCWVASGKKGGTIKTFSPFIRTPSMKVFAASPECIPYPLIWHVYYSPRFVFSTETQCTSPKCGVVSNRRPRYRRQDSGKPGSREKMKRRRSSHVTPRTLRAQSSRPDFRELLRMLGIAAEENNSGLTNMDNSHRRTVWFVAGPFVVYIPQQRLVWSPPDHGCSLLFRVLRLRRMVKIRNGR